MIALWMALAWSCDNPTERRVVGWSDDGSQALLRIEHPDEDGSIHALKLALLDRYGVAKEWTILEPEDNGHATLRGKRWSAAEAELTDMGVRILPDTQPLAGMPGEGSDLERDTIPVGNGTSIAFDSASINDSTTRFYDLLAERA